MSRVDMPTFSGGEIGDDLLARDDTQKYRTSLQRARNVFLAVGGGVYNRPGLYFCGPTYNPNWKARIIPFQFSVDQAYVIELTPFVMRFIVNGGFVLRPELKVLNITNEENAVIFTDGPSGYEVGWDVVLSGIEGMTEINGMQGRVIVVDNEANAIRVLIDTRSFGVYTGSTGGVPGASAGGVGGQPPPPVVEPPPPPETPTAPPPEPEVPPEPPAPFPDYVEPPNTWDWRNEYNQPNYNIP